MCGIAGFFAQPSISGIAAPETVLRSMQAALLHRGPDGRGLWLDPNRCAGLTHVRLAILDTSPAGAQPMLSPDGRFVLSFNGEIYNFHELRRELQAQGCDFRTNSDTEVLLALLQRHGPASLPRLRGMFALAFWDVQTRRGLLARDGFGIKPLYYSDTASGLVFASELRAVLAGSSSPWRLDAAAVAGFFTTGSVPEPATLVDGINMLPPGHFIEWSEGSSRIGRFWEPVFPEPNVVGQTRAISLTRSALEDSIQAHFISDVPVGLFLSGGIDSTALLALAHSTGHAQGLNTFSIAVDDPDFNEADIAAATARQFGVAHHVLRLDAAEARDSFSGFIDSMDVPSVDGFNTWTVSRLARSHGAKVVLSGLGGDEIFGGYPSFWQVPRLHQGTQALTRVPGLAKGLGHVMGRMRSSRWRRAGELLRPGNELHDAYRAYRGIFPSADAIRLAAHFTGHAEQTVRRSFRIDRPPLPTCAADRISYLEITRYMRNQLLRDSDLMSMAHGLELRLPLVDQRLFDTVSSIPASTRLHRKKLLLDAVPEIPAQVRNGRKRGFSFPVRNWLQQDLGPEFASATQGLPVTTPEWYQQWSVLTFIRWMDARGRADSPAHETSAQFTAREQEGAL
ncbi:MAG: asparagine synthase (glutamine-hydrolyzing) [Lysobacter sp.]|nr:asparagine synthase (glutamine-hydrolyzing) [Lysobacter sp.]